MSWQDTFGNRFRGSPIIVTGATGFIGRHLCEALAGLGATVFGVGRSAAGGKLPAGVKPIALDIRDPSALAHAFEGAKPEYVFHLAAIGIADPFLPIEVVVGVNVAGTLNVLEASRSCSVRRVVHIGTAYERVAEIAGGSPSNPYVASKYAACLFVRGYGRQYDIDAVSLRPFQVYGPRQPSQALIPAAILTALEGKVFRMTPGGQKRDFIFVNDVVEAIVTAALAPDVAGKTYDIGTGIAMSVGAAVQRIFELVKGKGSVAMGAVKYRPNETMALVADPGIAHSDFGWRPRTDFEQGIAQTINWYRKQRI